MVIQFYADSLGLPRPNIVKVEETYIQIFTNWLRTIKKEPVYLYDRAKGGAILEDLFATFKQDLTYIDGHKELLIIHEGICDCAPRPISPFTRRIIGRLPAYFRKKAINYIHNNRAALFKKGHIYYHTPKKSFKEKLEEWLKTATGEFDRIILFTIAPTNEETEIHSPGFSASINAYNNIIREVIRTIGSNKIKLIDTYTLINTDKMSIEKYITAIDGHHLTKEGHALYASKLKEIFSTDV